MPISISISTSISKRGGLLESRPGQSIELWQRDRETERGRGGRERGGREERREVYANISPIV